MGGSVPSPQLNSSSIQVCAAGIELLNLQKLVLRHICKILTCVARRPPDFDVLDPSGFSQATMLLHWRSTERPAASNRAIDRLCTTAFVLDIDFEAGTNRGTIAFDPHEPQIDPIVVGSRILKQPKGMRITRSCAASYGKDVVIAVSSQVGKRNRMTFMEFAGAGCRGNVREVFSIMISKQKMWNERRVTRVSISHINIKESVVVNIAEVRPHWHKDFVQPGFNAYILERTIMLIVVKPGGQGIVRQAHNCAHTFLDRDVEVRVAVIIIIGADDCFAERGFVHPSRVCNVLERSIAIVEKKLRGTVFSDQEQIQPTIVVYVSPHGTLCGSRRIGKLG